MIGGRHRAIQGFALADFEIEQPQDGKEKAMSKLKVVRSFTEQLRITHRRLEAARDAETNFNSKRVLAGQALLDLKEMVEAGEIGELATWWEWFRDNIRIISETTAKEYMRVASAENPVKEEAELRAGTAARQQAYRDRKSLESQDSGRRYVTPESEQEPITRITPQPKRYPTAPDDDHLLTEFIDIFKRMSWDARVRAVKAVTDLYKKWHRGED